LEFYYGKNQCPDFLKHSAAFEPVPELPETLYCLFFIADM
jgi:hypothetical protein